MEQALINVTNILSQTAIKLGEMHYSYERFNDILTASAFFSFIFLIIVGAIVAFIIDNR